MKQMLLATAVVFAGLPLFAGENGLIRKESAQAVGETVDALVTAMEGAGLKVFARVDHGAGAVSVGADIGASQLLIFGSPKVGTPALIDDPLAGLFLPLKVLVYQDAMGKAWIVYEDPRGMAEKLGGVSADAPYLATMSGALAKFTGGVAK